MNAGGENTDPVRRAGLDTLAAELYELRCEVALAVIGEHMYTVEQVEAMRRRVAELEPLVDERLRQMLDEQGDPQE